jgi:hypothetical protein
MDNEQLIHSIVRHETKDDIDKDIVFGHPSSKDKNIIYSDSSITSTSGRANDIPRYGDPIKQREL